MAPFNILIVDDSAMMRALIKRAVGLSGVSVGQIGALAADVMADAIVRAVRTATGVPGFPALRDLK